MASGGRDGDGFIQVSELAALQRVIRVEALEFAIKSRRTWPYENESRRATSRLVQRSRVLHRFTSPACEGLSVWRAEWQHGRTSERSTTLGGSP
jgi:hypothetical protein